MTPLIAYHASHEQFAPSHLLTLVSAAEAAGFDAIHSSDHFYPWNRQQGQSGFSFAWLGAAMQATRLPFSVICAPGGRYHPAVLAQAAATLSEMFPGRFSLELGSGEALNESVVGRWPSKQIRNEILKQSYEAIQLMLEGKEITMKGHIEINRGRLYTKPAVPPPVYGAALSEATAAWMGSWCDGMLTTAEAPGDTFRKIEAFLSNNSNLPVFLQYAFSYAATREEALSGAFGQWATNALPPEQLAELPRPEDFEAAAASIRPEDLEARLPLFTSVDALLKDIQKYFHPNVKMIVLHNVHPEQEKFLEDFARR